jgi:DNA-binding response OmpR family regulator
LAQSLPTPADDLAFGNLRVNLTTFSVLVGDRQADLTFFEFELLKLLCQDAGRIVHYDVLCRAMWNSAGAKERRRLNVTVFRMRAKLEDSWPYRIETVRGRGYGLITARP